MNSFKEKVYDGPYEVVEIQIENEGKIFRGIIYFPEEINFKKPLPIIIYLPRFPQILPFSYIAQELEYLLKLGYALILINLRGYKFSEGTISIPGQVSDGLKIIEFVELMAEKGIFDKNQINILAHDFAAYIALIIASKTDKIKLLGLLHPILDVERHANNDAFAQNLHYINIKLPGMIHGIEDIPGFIEKTKKELQEFPIKKVICNLKAEKIIVILGDKDKITPMEEYEQIFQRCNINYEETIVQEMDHEPSFEFEKKIIEEALSKFFKEIV